MIQQARAELGRALGKYFGGRGGDVPDVAPVVVVDDFGGYPAYQRWARSETQIAVAAQYSYICIQNTDGADSGSQLTVDYIGWRMGAVGQDLDVALVPIATFTPGSTTTVWDLAPEAIAGGQGGASAPKNVGNILLGHGSSAAKSVHFSFYCNDTVFHDSNRFPSIVLGPQMQLLVSSSSLNALVQALFAGRYYPAR